MPRCDLLTGAGSPLSDRPAWLPWARCEYVSVSVFQSVEDRDGMVQSGMEEGASEGYDRLAELIQSLP